MTVTKEQEAELREMIVNLLDAYIAIMRAKVSGRTLNHAATGLIDGTTRDIIYSFGFEPAFTKITKPTYEDDEPGVGGFPEGDGNKID